MLDHLRHAIDSDRFIGRITSGKPVGSILQMERLFTRQLAICPSEPIDARLT
jgi:hypothetical protein